MWRTRRQTKKHKTKNRPKALFQTAFYVIGAVAIVFVGFSVVSLTTYSPLIMPVSFSQSVKGVKAIFAGSDKDEVEALLKQKNISYLFVTSSTEAAYVITLPDNAEVLIGSEDIPSQIASLQHITSRLTMEGKRFSRLDLRFDRPVIVLK